ncbi:AraC family transcriptional regulator [Bradyrhizobium sp. S3.2.12]|uniref:AraC family transcriptional regulator n=1 Tax=Bradyrhizobium sp. S3.2.12 TaxID=3156387 RepID=UPI0033961BA1
MPNYSSINNDKMLAASDQGLSFCRPAASDLMPRYLESGVMAPVRTIGVGAKSSLKAAFWRSTVEQCDHNGDPDFVCIALNTGGGPIWRNNETIPSHAGSVAMQPFEGARWRFERPVSFVQLYVPFTLLQDVSESIFNRELAHDKLRMPSGIGGDICGAARSVRYALSLIEPTNLILDSWALILSEILARQFSSHGDKHPRTSFGKIPALGVARVVDYIEASIDRDLDLASLASVASMSVYHFARRFRETIGVSPHAYILCRRIRRAQEMLHRGGSSLTQVSAACGFSSQAHLTTAFRRGLGVTPGEYRRTILHGRLGSSLDD